MAGVSQGPHTGGCAREVRLEPEKVTDMCVECRNVYQCKQMFMRMGERFYVQGVCENILTYVTMKYEYVCVCDYV